MNLNENGSAATAIGATRPAPAVAGQITHHALGHLLARYPDGQPVPHALVHQTVQDAAASVGRRAGHRRVRAMALTATSKYLLHLRPTACSFLGAEAQMGAGRADLLWARPDGSWFIDEVKTGRVLQVDLAVDQARRYAVAAAQTKGFLGVRIVDVTVPARSLLVPSDLRVLPLAGTQLSFGSLRQLRAEVI